MATRTTGRELQFRLLGHLVVRGPDGEIALGSPKQKAVLAVLLLNANEIVSTDRIIHLVWGDSPPRTAEHSVQIYVSELRKSLTSGSPSDWIVTRPPGYVINVPPEAVDTARFERLVREGLSASRAVDLEHARASLEAALTLWVGDPLVDFAYDEFAQGYIRSLRELRCDALEALAEIYLDSGNSELARDLARQAAQIDPLREIPQRVIMLALYRSGRQADALRHFRAYRESLIDELGIEPSDDLGHLEERILLQDEGLDLVATHPVGGNPYRGLRAFSETDADIYFGRETLVGDVLSRLDAGYGFVSIVGPSGSGKSSAARAGVIPALKETGATAIAFQPGPRPLWELAGVLDDAGFGSRGQVLRRLEETPDALAELVTRPLTLVIDQFEELFTLVDSEDRDRFVDLVASAVRAERSRLSVVATLRADYYDKPLSMPALAGLFSNSVVSVRPMTPEEIERAVVRPAQAVGADVEPALLAQLVADMGDEPGALPLLQYTLFEMFEKSTGLLSLNDYRALGGINGALTGGADELLQGFDAEGRDLVEQLMMRMVQCRPSTSTARPVAVRELLDLDVDIAVLNGVLEAFAARRLITFDRDSSGASVVEMAHEYLLTEWPQMGVWLGAHSEDLERLSVLQQAAGEWIGAGRSDDFLLRGQRLAGFEEWRDGTNLILTSTENRFVDASIELRRGEADAEKDRELKEEMLRRSARRRLWGFGLALVSLAAAVTWLVVALVPAPPPDVILWGRVADDGLGALLNSGFETAVESHGLEGEIIEVAAATDPIVRDAVSRGTRLVLLDVNLAGDPVAAEIIADHPNTTFVWIDCLGIQPEAAANEFCTTSRHEEMGFLAGAVAAVASKNSHVGIVLGQPFDNMFPFQEGFEQGARLADPLVSVGAIYLSDEAAEAFNTPTLGYLGAGTLIDRGADVIFAAAGLSGFGVIEAAYDYAQTNDGDVWSIGVDFDEQARMESWKSEPWAQGLPIEGWQDHILTSVVKRVDQAVVQVIDDYFTTGEVGPVELTVANGGIDFVPSDGLREIEHELETIRSALADGSIQIVLDGDVDIEMLRDAVAP
ncbi:MAG TPA: BTAD domain-containing putative transcriptional regulator [Acidimicrobiia bacterium]|nr:BTAD domain-containing putative transcriptional regulator [Acidimicrobiia bacterium]